MVVEIWREEAEGGEYDTQKQNDLPSELPPNCRTGDDSGLWGGNSSTLRSGYIKIRDEKRCAGRGFAGKDAVVRAIVLRRERSRFQSAGNLIPRLGSHIGSSDTGRRIREKKRQILDKRLPHVKWGNFAMTPIHILDVRHVREPGQSLASARIKLPILRGKC